MRQKLLIFLLCVPFYLSQAQQSEPIVFSIDGVPTYKSEVEEAYSRNNNNGVGEATSGRDNFIQSYIDFKLNVIEAKAQKLDTTANYKREYSSYKIQLSNSYLKNTEVEKQVMQILFNRTRTEVEINQAFLPFDKELLLPSDTLALYNKALDLRNTLIQKGFVGDGFEDYTKLTGMVLDRETKSGYMGWIIPFMMPRRVEDAIYSLSINEISYPIRTLKGYHIVQVLNKRPAQDLINIDQVLFTFSRIPATQQQIDSVRNVADNVYKEYLKSNNWESLCNAYVKANNIQGDGCNFGTYALDGQLPPSFLTAAFGLKKEGDVSAPVMTDYGFHLIHLNKKIPLPDFKGSEDALSKRIRFTDRSEYASDAYRKQLALNYHLDIDQVVYAKIKNIANTIDPYDPSFISNVTNVDDILFSIDGLRKYKVIGFLNYVKEKAGLAEERPIVTYNVTTDRFDDLFNSYIYQMLMSYAEETLEAKYPEFEKLINTFVEGTLYFDVKNKNVWNPSRNIDALSKFYDKNKAKYNNVPFEEVRGQVESDYQEQLEQFWTASLRKKYKVKINESVLDTIK